MKKRAILWMASVVRIAFDRAIAEAKNEAYQRGYKAGHRDGGNEAWDDVAANTIHEVYGGEVA